MRQVKTMPDRLLELMSLFDINQHDMCVKTGIHKSAMSSYVSGRRPMGKKTLETIANCYNVSVDWLMGYDVDLKGETSRDKVLINYFGLLNPRDKLLILNLMESMVNNENRETAIGDIQGEENP